MKPLVCQMCGSSDIVRRGRLYVCRACDTKYTLDQNSELMVEEEEEPLQGLDLLKAQAKGAVYARNWDEAYSYFKQILEQSPNDWEAYYSTVFYTAFLANPEEHFTQLSERLSVMEGAVSTINKLLKEQYRGGNVMMEATSLWTTPLQNCDSLWHENYKTLQDNIKFFQSVENGRIQEENRSTANLNMKACVDLMFAIVQDFQVQYGTSMKYWYLVYAENAADYASRTPGYKRADLKKINTFIKILEPDYEEKKKEGCYVATAVYGSYDCPEVWTLRRFRDYTLADTLAGRTFIRVYYALSPTLVRWFGKSRLFKALCLPPLSALVRHLQSKGVASTPYRDRY